MEITEADEASNTLQGALDRYAYQFEQYKLGLESLGVADMYELTCIKMGATGQQLRDAQNKHPNAVKH